MEQNGLVLDNASDFYNKLLANYELEYKNFSDEEKKQKKHAKQKI